MEGAARRRVDRGRRVARDDDAKALLLRIGRRHRAEQRARVRMQRRRVELLGRALLDDLAEVHHRDALADVPHDAEIVRDEEEGDAELVLQIHRAG